MIVTSISDGDIAFNRTMGFVGAEKYVEIKQTT